MALVPTMGALHAGNLALIAEGKRRADRVVATIFVNPTAVRRQRGSRPLSPARGGGREPARASRLRPAVDAGRGGHLPGGLFDHGERLRRVGAVGRRGPRPGHFDGVATVVAKLCCGAPDVAMFGEKDFQQLWSSGGWSRDLDIPVEIVGGPPCARQDGLALSSRNAYLSADERPRNRPAARSRRGPRIRSDAAKASPGACKKRNNRSSTPASCASIIWPWSMQSRWSRWRAKGEMRLIAAAVDRQHPADRQSRRLNMVFRR